MGSFFFEYLKAFAQLEAKNIKMKMVLGADASSIANPDSQRLRGGLDHIGSVVEERPQVAPLNEGLMVNDFNSNKDPKDLDRASSLGGFDSDFDSDFYCEF